MGEKPKVEIYYWSTCPHCHQARALLDSKAVVYTGYDITGDDSARTQMIERTGGPRTVPQIFIDDVLIGGNSDLQELEQLGKLDVLLNV